MDVLEIKRENQYLRKENITLKKGWISAEAT